MVEPSGPLSGTVRAGGAKNSALKLMAACLLAEGRIVLSNVPRITDVDTMAEVLRAMGAEVERHDAGDVEVTAPPEGDLVPEGPYELFERMRASVVVARPAPGPLRRGPGAAARVGTTSATGPSTSTSTGWTPWARASSPPTARCAARCPGGRLVGTRVVLEYPSHTATDNLLMAGVLAKGTTVIENAAKEPEVADLAAMLCAMGAVVRGAGTSRIEIEGVEELRPAHHTVVARPGRGGHVPGRRRHGRGRGHGRRRPPRTHGDAAAQGATRWASRRR